jgi:hypothetical protein
MHQHTASLPVAVQRALRGTFSAAALVTVVACATTGTTGGGTPTTSAPTSTEPWPTVAREHVDLWLHGYAMLTRDTATVPFFERGYRDRMTQLKAQRNVYTQLDANRDKLSARFTVNPGLVNGQFVPLYFASWQELQQMVSLFLQAGGDPRASSDPTVQAYLGVLAASFPAAADRDWLRLYEQSLEEDRTRFYDSYWTSEQGARTATRNAVDSLWQRVYRPKLQRYLNNTQQDNGEIYLSLPLDGEGRTVNLGQRQNAVAVAFPDSPANAIEAVYVVVHEIVNAVTNVAIADNTTPAQQRSGAVSAYAANVTVRGGAMLLQKIAPELVAGYERYYLRSANRTVPSGSATVAFEAAFPIPNEVRDAVARQLEVVLGGI